MSCHVTYANEELIYIPEHEQDEILKWFRDWLPRNHIYIGMQNFPQPRDYYNERFFPRLNLLYWPRNARRWARYFSLVNERQARRLRLLVNQDQYRRYRLRLALGNRTIDPYMWLLPLIPIVINGLRRLWLAYFVDDRYWWWS